MKPRAVSAGSQNKVISMQKVEKFSFFASYLEAACRLSEKDRKDFIYAIVQYGINGEEIPLKKSLQTLWVLVKPTLDSSRKYHNSGKKGGIVSKPPSQKSESPLNEGEEAPLGTEKE